MRSGRSTAPLFILVLASVYKDRVVRVDIRSEMSSSKAFGAYLNASREFHDAILLPEPDYFIESLPYYAHNPISSAKERRFGTTVTWSMAAAVVVVGHPGAMTDATGEIWYLYNRHFTWSVRERKDAERALTPVAEFKAAAEEKYWIYAVQLIPRGRTPRSSRYPRARLPVSPPLPPVPTSL